MASAVLSCQTLKVCFATADIGFSIYYARFGSKGRVGIFDERSFRLKAAYFLLAMFERLQCEEERPPKLRALNDRFGRLCRSPDYVELP